MASLRIVTMVRRRWVIAVLVVSGFLMFTWYRFQSVLQVWSLPHSSIHTVSTGGEAVKCSSRTPKERPEVLAFRLYRHPKFPLSIYADVELEVPGIVKVYHIHL
jgi:hypothetical protein